MTSYEENKEYILKYQKNSKQYKDYKKSYDRDYLNKNRNYAGFRSTKSRLYSKFGEEIGKVKLLVYLLKKQSKGHDMTKFIEKLNYIAK